MKKIIIEKTILNEIIQRNQKGEILKDLRKEFNIDDEVLRRNLYENNYFPNRRDFSDEEIKQLIHLYKSETLTKICKVFKCRRQRIMEILEENGVKLRTASEYIALSHQNPNSRFTRKYSVNESVFDFINEESAYWIGFLMADGCIYRTKIILWLQIRDINHVEKFKAFLESEHPIRKKTCKSPRSENMCEQAGISIDSRKLVDILSGYGITPKKSHTARIVGLEFNRHFWRGVIDGDGCVRFQGNTPVISLCGSHFLVNQFLSFVKTIVDTKTKPRQYENYSTITFDSKQAFQIISSLYDESTIYLERKHRLAEKNRDVRFKLDEIKANSYLLATTVKNLYLSGILVKDIQKRVGIKKRAVFYYLNRYEELSGKKIPRRSKQSCYNVFDICDSKAVHKNPIEVTK